MLVFANFNEAVEKPSAPYAREIQQSVHYASARISALWEILRSQILYLILLFSMRGFYGPRLTRGFASFSTRRILRCPHAQGAVRRSEFEIVVGAQER